MTATDALLGRFRELVGVDGAGLSLLALEDQLAAAAAAGSEQARELLAAVIAYRWSADLRSGEVTSVGEVRAALEVARRHVARLLELDRRGAQ